MSRDLVKEFEERKARRDKLQEKWSKIDVAQKVAAEKVSSLEGELRDMGIDPDKVEEWLAEEEKRLTSELAEFDSLADKAEKELTRIEKEVFAASEESA